MDSLKGSPSPALRGVCGAEVTPLTLEVMRALKGTAGADSLTLTLPSHPETEFPGGSHRSLPEASARAMEEEMQV